MSLEDHVWQSEDGIDGAFDGGLKRAQADDAEKEARLEVGEPTT